MGLWTFFLAWVVHAAFIQRSFCADDLCEPSFGFEKFIILQEDTEIGTVVLALDTPGTPGEINLTLPDNDHFAFNASSQELYVRQKLDAEATPSIYRLTINCKEGNKPPVYISVKITVNDVNDNPPTFANNHYYLDLSETTAAGQLFDTGMEAVDPDNSYNNRAVFYSVMEGTYSDYFQFSDALVPVLVLRKSLDFELLPNLTITVVAKNDLSTVKLNSTALLTIRVIDEDDLNPIFTSPLYEGFVMANSPQDTLVNITPQIMAADADVTLDVPVVYSFHDAHGSGKDKVFAIDNKTAQVTLVGTVRPTKVSIVIQATQKDNPSRYGVAMLVITVAGVSTNPPAFPSDTYRAFVSEMVPPGTTVLVVTATDIDFGSVIQYSIVGGSSLFAITADSGAIRITSPLDFETTRVHTFTVMASDGELNTTTTVEVEVMDANDNTPVVTKPNRTFQVERTKDLLITTIEAYDADVGTKLSFSLVNHQNLFSIDNSGNLRISGNPKELTRSEYLLLVVVSDDGRSPRERSLFVTVQLPPLTGTTTVSPPAAVMAGPSDDTVAIALGVVAAVLLIVIIVLVFYICRRRNQNSEQLDRVKARRTPDPRGLKFKNANRSRLDHIQFQGDDSLDGATTVQDNPLKQAGAFNYGFVHPDDPESDRNMDEIHIETAVIPYRTPNDAYNNNNSRISTISEENEMFQQQHQQAPEEDSSDYGDSLPHKRSLIQPSHHRSPHHDPYQPNTSTESLSTGGSRGCHTSSSSSGELAPGEAGGSQQQRQLMGNGTTAATTTSIGTTSFGSMDIGTTSFSTKRGDGGGEGGVGGGSTASLPTGSLDGLDPDHSVIPSDQKSELTVYF